MDRIEKAGADFYTRLALKTEDIEKRQLMEYLAREELQHRDVFDAMLSAEDEETINRLLVPARDLFKFMVSEIQEAAATDVDGLDPNELFRGWRRFPPSSTSTWRRPLFRTIRSSGLASRETNPPRYDRALQRVASPWSPP